MSPTAIAWTDETWNPIRGCSKVSEGCRNCYAMHVAARFSGPGQVYEGLATRSPARWTGEVRFVEDRLREPLSWQRPRRIFVNSMSDLFHEGVPDEWIDRIFGVMALSPWHTFQVLTKRPERMRDYLLEQFQGRTDLPAGPYDRHGKVLEAVEALVYSGEGLWRFNHDRWWTPEGRCIAFAQPWPLPNVWLGVSTEDQATFDDRVPLLLQTPTAVRFISAEPLLGPIDMRGEFWGALDRSRLHGGLDWVIAGGESGPHARACDPEWLRSIRDQCTASRVPFFLKQLGGHPDKRADERAVLDDQWWTQMPAAIA